MSIAQTHLTETRVRLTTSPVIRTFSVIEERVGLDYGYLRVRVELVNHDFLELNAQHHPELPNFPHHTHEGDEANVHPVSRSRLWT